MKQSAQQIWTTDSGRVLLTLEGDRVFVRTNHYTPEEREELAEAAVEAAQALRDRTEVTA